MRWATLNPADTVAGITLSSQNLEALCTLNVTNQSTRSTGARTTGKVYCEMLVKSMSGNGILVGISDTSASNVSGWFPGKDTHSYGQTSSGSYYYNNTPVGSKPVFASGNIVMIAFDIDNGLLWFGKNGVWNTGGNPATGASPDYMGIPKTIPWMIGIDVMNGDCSMNFGATPFAYSVPSGFTGWSFGGISIYRNTDNSAPQLAGQAGKLINVLDACLVNGYAGKAPLGQTKAFSGTNLASYQMPVGTSQSYLAIDDSPAQYPRIRGFRTMTAAGPAAANGTNPQPNEYQLAGGMYALKSNVADANLRSQTLISNGKIFYLWVDGFANGWGGRTFIFGDISSYNPQDVNPCILVGILGDYKNRILQVSEPNGYSTVYTHVIASRFDGMTWSVPFGKMPMKGLCGKNDSGYGNPLQYPDPLYGGYNISPVYVHETLGGGKCILRGFMPGFWWVGVAGLWQASDSGVTQIVGTPGTDLEGRTFEVYGGQNDANNGWYLIEVSDTWDTTFWK